METWWRETSDSYCHFRPAFRKVLCAVAFCRGQMLVVLPNVILGGFWLRSRQAFRFPTPVWASNTWFNGKLNTWLDVVTIWTSTGFNLWCVQMGFELVGSRHKLFRGAMKKRPLVKWDCQGPWETLLSWIIHMDVHSGWLCSFCSKLSPSWAWRCNQKNGFCGRVKQSVQMLHCVIQHGTMKYRKMEYIGFMSLCKRNGKGCIHYYIFLEEARHSDYIFL